MSILAGTSGNILYATAYNDDGSIKDDVAFNETSIALVVERDGLADSSAITLSAKATKATAHSAGAFFNHGRGIISVDVADSFFASTNRRIALGGTFDGGYIVGEPEQVVAFDPNSVAVGANTVVPTNLSASQVRTELAIELGRIDENVSAAKTLTAATLSTLFDDSDASQQLTDFFAGLIERFDDAGDTPVAAIASAMIAGLVSNSQWIELLADAEAARSAAVAAGNAIGNLPAPLTASEIAAAAATGVLATPANKIASNASGAVTTSNPSTGGTGSAHTAQDVADLINPATASSVASVQNALTNAINTRATPAQVAAVTSGITTLINGGVTLTPTERSALAGVLDLAIINQADGADLIGALANAIADDWVASDASPLAVVSALIGNATFVGLVADATAARSAAEANSIAIAGVQTGVNGVIKSGEARTISRDGKDDIAFTEVRN